jgi:uncharacterized protein involved in tellurium resistance
VDLDLMAFYKSKSGQVGGIFSDNYEGGSFGSLTGFPYIYLSGDAGVGEVGGVKEETIQIGSMNELAEIHICAINFTDASKNRESTFSSYDAEITIVDEQGEAVVVPLNSAVQGTVAVIAKIDNSGMMGPKMVNENNIMKLSDFQSTIPGAGLLKIASKIVLKKKGDSFLLKPKGGNLLGEIMVNLNWNQSIEKKGIFKKRQVVDLDLGCLFELDVEYAQRKMNLPPDQANLLSKIRKGSIQPLGSYLGDFNNFPFILHLGDDRTGSWAEGENLRINASDVNVFKRILVYTYIYEGAPSWAKTDAVVTVKGKNIQEIEIRMDEFNDNLTTCSLVLFTNMNNSMNVKKVINFFPSQMELDQHFGWGMKWTVGAKE